MGFSPEVAERYESGGQAQEVRWLREPGWHEVEIAGWHYEPRGTRRAVVFELRDARCGRQRVRFQLGVRILRGGELLRFIVAALGWNPLASQGLALAVAAARYYKRTIGHRIRVYLVRNRRGYHDVIDWAPASTEPLGSGGSTTIAASTDIPTPHEGAGQACGDASPSTASC